ncbi:MAG: anti-sigma factor domain-containing protein [Desulfitobacterium hafniense]|nr:anti-sigma factor domain-containing protein [Desulfitobacterium hafniense]
MKKNKGIVMKTSKKATIIYTDSGDYLKIKTPKDTPAIGQVIEVELPVRKPLSHGLLRYGSTAAILLLALTLGVFNILSGANTAVAAVVMDIDSSVEILVDSQAKVLKVKDRTQGSKSAPSDLQLKGMDIYSAVALIIDKADKEGAFKQKKNLVLASIVPLDNQKEDVIDPGKLRDSIHIHMLEKSIPADMMVGKADENTMKMAQDLGMSVNHYQIFERIQKQGLMVDPDTPSSNNALHMLTEANTTLVSLFPQESISITPQGGMHNDSNPMGNPMAGNSNMPSMNSDGADYNQNSPNNGSTSSGYSMPGSQHKGSSPSEPMLKQGSSGSTGEHQMMPSSDGMGGMSSR